MWSESVRSPAAQIARAARLSLTTLHALVVLVIVELLVRWLPLPRSSHLLGVRLNLAPVASTSTPMRLGELPPTARRQIRCTNVVADAWPFSKGPCLRRSLVAGHLLRRYQPAVRLGIGGSGEGLHAHAWLEIDDRPLESVAEFSAFESVPVVRR